MANNERGHLLNKTNMSRSLGISVQAFDKWHVFPVEKVGREAFYSVRDVLDNRLEKQKPSSAEDLDITEERARLTHHQANIAALDEKVKEGELIPSEVVETVWTDIIANFRAKVLSIPTKSAHAMIGLTDLNEAQELLKSHIYEALEELSHYDPEQYGIETVSEGDQNNSASA